MTRKKRKKKNVEVKAAAKPAPPPPAAGEEEEKVKEKGSGPDSKVAAKTEEDWIREIEDFRERLQRTAADFANYQKRAQRETADVKKYAASPLALDLLGILDDFQRALAAAAGKLDADFLHGFMMIEAQLRETLQKHGVKPIEALNEPFDPNVHDALMEVEDDELPDKTVKDEIQKGYMIHDRLLRPTRVRVSRRPAPPKADESEKTETEEEAEGQEVQKNPGDPKGST